MDVLGSKPLEVFSRLVLYLYLTLVGMVHVQSLLSLAFLRVDYHRIDTVLQNPA